MINDNIPFESWFKRDYSSDTSCFLCGTELVPGKYTREHILPQWVLNKFGLWDKKITLLNGSSFPYRFGFIPCCNTCNNEHLSKLEEEIKKAVEHGFQYFEKNIDPLRIYQWAQLIFYKWVFKETFLKENIKDPRSEKIVKELNFNGLALNHLFLRSIDKNIQFTNFFPGSVFLCRVKTSADVTMNFDYLDDIPSQCFSIRLNDIGIIVMLADASLQKMLYSEQYQEILSHELNPIQFKNLFIKCVYAQYLFRDPFSYSIRDISEGSLNITCIEKEGFDGYVYGEWNDNDYLQLLSNAFNNTPENLKGPDGKAGSFFYDEKGNWKDRSFDDEGFRK